MVENHVVFCFVHWVSQKLNANVVTVLRPLPAATEDNRNRLSCPSQLERLIDWQFHKNFRLTSSRRFRKFDDRNQIGKGGNRVQLFRTFPGFTTKENLISQIVN